MKNNEFVEFYKTQQAANRLFQNSINKLEEKVGHAKAFSWGVVCGLILTVIIKILQPYLINFFKYLNYLYSSMTADGKFNIIVVIPITILLTLLTQMFVNKIRQK